MLGIMTSARTRDESAPPPDRATRFPSPSDRDVVSGGLQLDLQQPGDEGVVIHDEDVLARCKAVIVWPRHHLFDLAHSTSTQGSARPCAADDLGVSRGNRHIGATPEAAAGSIEELPRAGPARMHWSASCIEISRTPRPAAPRAVTHNTEGCEGEEGRVGAGFDPGCRGPNALVRLQRVTQGLRPTMLAKLEMLNPGKPSKDPDRAG